MTMKKPKKCNEREEIACQAVVRGLNQVDAYREGYPASRNYKDAVTRVKACELFKRPHVAARRDQLMKQSAARNGITVDSLIKELEENRKAALTAETPQASAANAATMGKAKLLGLDKQIIDHTSSDGSMTPKNSINVALLSDSVMAEILKAFDDSDE